MYCAEPASKFVEVLAAFVFALAFAFDAGAFVGPTFAFWADGVHAASPATQVASASAAIVLIITDVPLLNGLTDRATGSDRSRCPRPAERWSASQQARSRSRS